MMAAGLNRSASRLEADRNSASERPRHDDDSAAQGQLQTPPVPDPANDVDQLAATVGPAVSVKHVGDLLQERIHPYAGSETPGLQSVRTFRRPGRLGEIK